MRRPAKHTTQKDTCKDIQRHRTQTKRIQKERCSDTQRQRHTQTTKSNKSRHSATPQKSKRDIWGQTATSATTNKKEKRHLETT